jgi:N-formylglutamate amidohydrolase
MQAALSTSRSKRRDRVAVLFTAHSVPARTIEPSEGKRSSLILRGQMDGEDIAELQTSLVQKQAASE